MSSPQRLFVSFPEPLVPRPMVYELVKRFDVIPNIRRADVEDHSGWMILELGGQPASCEAAVNWLREQGCVVDDMQGDIIAG
jgi:L-aspartate semialdehyde sulfurtransferase ferredoxin